MDTSEKDEGFSGELLNNHARRSTEKAVKKGVPEQVPAEPTPDGVGRRHTSFVDDRW